MAASIDIPQRTAAAPRPAAPPRFPVPASQAHDDLDDAAITRSTRIISLIAVLMGAMLTWSYIAELDEVSTGSGRVVPTSREQVVQSLEGGIVAVLKVREGDIVEAGQVLAQLDPTRTESNVDESAARYRAALATSARLAAEVNLAALSFPDELAVYPDLLRTERQLYQARRDNLQASVGWVDESLKLLRNELRITESLSKIGAASDVEVLRLRRQIAELELKKTEFTSEYVVRAREELNRARAEVEALSSVLRGRTDSLTRLTHRSPVRGIVKDIEVTTVGGVIPPNGKLMAIVPLDDQLLIETRISPRDIAFIHPDQRAIVKITAYDYSIYGGLNGKVVTISPDTIQDEAKPDVHYYRVYIRTDTDALVNAAGQRFDIVPGMIASVDIQSGNKSVFDYLVKPLNRAREALRER